MSCPVVVHAIESRPPGLVRYKRLSIVCTERSSQSNEEQEREYRATHDEYATRVGKRKGPRSVALRGGRGGLTKQVSQSVMRFYRSLLYISKIFYLPKFFIHPLPPRSHTLRGPSFPCGDGFSTHPSCSTIPSGKHAFSIQKSYFQAHFSLPY